MYLFMYKYFLNKECNVFLTWKYKKKMRWNIKQWTGTDTDTETNLILIACLFFIHMTFLLIRLFK